MGVERAEPSRAGARLFAAYAFASLVPVVVLGVVLVRTEQRSSLARGLAQGGAQAAVIAQMAIAPTLDGRDLGAGLTDSERDRLHHATDLSIYSGSLTAIRLRSFAGDVVFADDGGSADPLPRTDPAFLTAAGGGTAVAVVRALSGAAGRVIRVLLPVVPNSTGQAVGVLELYLPYGPIEAAGRAEAHQTYLRLAQGLGLLYLVLALISWSTTRRLRVYAARQAYHARHDALTGLPNRSWYREQAQTALAAATRGQPGAIVLIDLDRFKEVNDTLGHHAGDELLECVAQRLRASLRTDDRVARLGGDEFGLILPGISNPQTALDLLARVQQELGADVEIAGRTLSIEASFGVAMYPEHGTDLSLLMRHADAAMYQGKRGIERIVVWHPGTPDAPTRSHEIQSELQRALEQDELVLYYQPKLNLESGQVHGMEALLRWNHPERGLLPPSEFIAAAEASTLIEPLTRWVLHRALTDQRAWKARGACWAVAVNVSVHNLESSGFAEYVLRQVRDAGAQPSDLTLELTETAVAADNALAAAAIATLDRAGVTVSLDDFGTGATGLLQLRNLAVREMKIDRAFVTDLAHNSHDRGLVRALVDLGHRLGCRVVAEGVEEQHCADWLQSVGCDDAQGFLYQRPAPWQSMLAHFGPSVPTERVAAAAPGSASVADHAASEASPA